jgi:hypothetical protein
MGSCFAAMLGSDIQGTALARMLSIMAAGLGATVNRFAPSLFEMPRQAPIPVEPRLDRRIPAPNTSEYQAIREQRDWPGSICDPCRLQSRGLSCYRIFAGSLPNSRSVIGRTGAWSLCNCRRSACRSR